MGYCNFYGKIVPGDKASCIGGGGDWIDTEPAPSYKGGATQDPGLLSAAYNGLGSSYKGGATQDPSKVNLFYNPDTDDFGNPLSTDAQGRYNFEELRDRAIGKFSQDAYDGVGRYAKKTLGPVDRTTTAQPRMVQTKSGLRPMTPAETGAQDRENVRQKLDVFTKGLGKTVDEAKLSIAKATAPEVPSLLRPNVPPADRPIGPLNAQGLFQKSDPAPSMVSKDKDTVAVDIGDGRKTWMSKEEAAKFKKNQEKSKGTDNKTDIPAPEAVKNMAVNGDIPKSLLDQMGTKDYWLSGVKGGAGDWDNRLFRLGEMMAHMGTPLSKRGDSPAKRWTAASTASAKAGSGISKATRQDWRNMIANEETLIKKFLKKKKGVFIDSKPSTEEYAAAASKAANYIMIGNQLISEEIQPTPENIQKRANKLKEEEEKKKK